VALKINGKYFLVLAGLLPLVCTGCGGINTSQGFSPALFFLKTEPKPPAPWEAPVEQPARQLAQVQ
jgi:hypothetical protein